MVYALIQIGPLGTGFRGCFSKYEDAKLVQLKLQSELDTHTVQIQTYKVFDSVSEWETSVQEWVRSRGEPEIAQF